MALHFQQQSLYLVGFLAAPVLLQRSLPSSSHTSTLTEYYDLTTLISEVSDFIAIAICSIYARTYVYCEGSQPYVQSHVVFMACQIIKFLDLLLSLSQQIIAWGYFVPDQQWIQLIITIPLLPADLCPLESWQANATAVRLPLPPQFLRVPSRRGHICNEDMWGGVGCKKQKQTRIWTFVAGKKIMPCTCWRAQPGERSPWQVRVCQGGIAWGHSQFPRVRGEALEAWFISRLSLLSYLMWRLTGRGLNDRN